MQIGAVAAFCDSGAVYKCHDLLTYLLKISDSAMVWQISTIDREGDVTGRFPNV